MKEKKTKTPQRDRFALNETDFSLSLGEMLGAPPPPKSTDEEPDPPEKEPAAAPRYSQVTLQRTAAGRGGKWVTRILFKPAQSHGQLEVLAKTLRKGLGCGSHVEENSVIVQGDISDRLELWFQKQGVQKIVR